MACTVATSTIMFQRTRNGEEREHKREKGENKSQQLCFHPL